VVARERSALDAVQNAALCSVCRTPVRDTAAAAAAAVSNSAAPPPHPVIPAPGMSTQHTSAYSSVSLSVMAIRLPRRFPRRLWEPALCQLCHYITLHYIGTYCTLFTILTVQ